MAAMTQISKLESLGGSDSPSKNDFSKIISSLSNNLDLFMFD